MRQSVAATGLGVIAVAMASSFACRQIVNFRDEPSSTAPPGSGESPAPGMDGGAACDSGDGTSRCASCVSAHCCSAMSSCATDPACAPYAACVGACGGDPTCSSQCAIDSPPGNSKELPALTACLVSQCESECGLTCGGIASGANYGEVAPDASAACQSCIVSTPNGCDVARACAASVDCNAVRLCFGACAGQDCKEACQNANDAGQALSLALKGVTEHPCEPTCAGADWACVGRVGWSQPLSDRVTMTIQVKDYFTRSTFSDVDVSVCGGNDGAQCLHNVAEGPTDDAGIVTFEFANPPGFTAFGLSGYVRLSSPKFLPTLYYWGFPLSEPEFRLTDSNGWTAAIEVLTLAAANALGMQAAGVPYDPSKSLVVANVIDCESHHAPSVQVTTNPADPDARKIYGLMATNMATDSLGLATFVGLPTGSVEVIATPLALGRPASRQMGYVQPGWVTAMFMAPTPAP